MIVRLQSVIELLVLAISEWLHSLMAYAVKSQIGIHSVSVENGAIAVICRDNVAPGLTFVVKAYANLVSALSLIGRWTVVRLVSLGNMVKEILENILVKLLRKISGTGRLFRWGKVLLTSCKLLLSKNTINLSVLMCQAVPAGLGQTCHQGIYG